MFKRILVPVDFTDKNLPALNLALRLALANQSRLILLHVIEKIENLSASELRNFYQRLQKSAKQKMKVWARRLREQEDIEIDERILYGQRAREIINYAIRNRIDLIVLSSHKVKLDNPLSGWGTVSYKLAILSQCPVLLVK